MRELEERILRDGRAIGERMLRVDSFLNMRVDAELMLRIGGEFADFAREVRPDFVATAEASGIAPAFATALAARLPLVVFKKLPKPPEAGGYACARVRSYTKGTEYCLAVRDEYVREGERALFVDDFLAEGEAALGAASIIEGRGAIVAGVAIAIEKSFQSGRGKLDARGYAVRSLARVARLSPTVEFL